MLDLEWILEPTAWAGLATLVVIEIVLGIDNLIFIAILSDKLAPEQRRMARQLGLSLALLMRIILLFAISWMAKLTAPIFTVIGNEISGRDLIMLFGGVFLLFKGTKELHEKLEGRGQQNIGPIHYAVFWQVILQIVALDAVFSLDAVITAVGMTEHLSIMICAVCIAIGLMIWASTPLMNFVSAHPTVVILCLGFLLMIGFSLIVDGLGYHIPKGYLYAAIGFSVAIEALNQLASRNMRKKASEISPRLRLTNMVLNFLQGREKSSYAHTGQDTGEDKEDSFVPQEVHMMSRVLQLRDMKIETLMTPRHDLHWINVTDPPDVIKADITDCAYSSIIAVDEKGIEDPLGVLYKKELTDLLLNGVDIKNLRQYIREPVIIPNNAKILALMEMFRESRIHIAFVVDEYGTLKGVITLTDVAEAIMGDMPEVHETNTFRYRKTEDGSWVLNGNLSLHDLKDILSLEDVPAGDYSTVAGMVLSLMKYLPAIGDETSIPGWTIRVKDMDGNRLTRLKFIPDARNNKK